MSNTSVYFALKLISFFSLFWFPISVFQLAEKILASNKEESQKREKRKSKCKSKEFAQKFKVKSLFQRLLSKRIRNTRIFFIFTRIAFFL